MIGIVTVPAMPYEIDPFAGIPSYVQLADQLRERINAGDYPERAPIPSLTQLRQETGLAKNTITHAIDLLEEEGLVFRVPGRGTFVRPKR